MTCGTPLGTIYYHFQPVRIFYTFLHIFSVIFFSFLKFPLNLQAGWGIWLEKFIPEECLYLHCVPHPLQRGKTKSSILKQVGRTILDEEDGIIFAVPRIPSILNLRGKDYDSSFRADWRSAQHFSPIRRDAMVNQLVRFMQEEEGATAIEYGLLASLIAMVIIGSVRTIGVTMNTAFTTVSTALGS